MMKWRNILGLSDGNTRKQTGTSWDRISFKKIEAPRFGDTGTHWDSFSDEVLMDMAATDSKIKEYEAIAEAEHLRPFPASKEYDGAQQAWKQRQLFIEQWQLKMAQPKPRKDGLTTSIRLQDLALTPEEMARWVGVLEEIKKKRHHSATIASRDACGTCSAL